MTSETKTKDTKTLYKDLREHYLAAGIYILPQRKEVTQIMELRLTPEEAELALSIPMQALGRISLEALAEKAGKGETEVWSMMESLLSKGIVYMQRSRRTGEEKYCLWDWWYSLLTPMWGDGLVDDTKLKVAELREKLWDAGYPFLLNPSTHPGGGRIMPYEPTLDPASPVPDYERYSHYVENAEAICVVACGCRMSVGKCREPVWNCMHFDGQVEYWTKYRRGREVTKEKALQLIEDSIRGGLVVTGSNSQDQPSVFCLCCRDCCQVLRPFILNFNTNAVARSNYLPRWDLEKCKICNTCQRACPTEAIGRHLSHQGGERDHRIVMSDKMCWLWRLQCCLSPGSHHHGQGSGGCP